MTKNKRPTKQGATLPQSSSAPLENQNGNTLPKFYVSVNKAGKAAIKIESLVGGEIGHLVGMESDVVGIYLMAQITNALEPHQDPSLSTDMLNNMTALLNELKPKDAHEGILTSQMIATHNQAMECLRRANLKEQTAYGRELNLRFGDRFLRTYTAQMEALTKYRRGGQQKVTVEHVHVHEGGQAIVGTVSHQGGEGDGKKKR